MKISALPPPLRNLADQLTLFKPRWADFAPQTTASHPGFKKLYYNSKLKHRFSIPKLMLGMNLFSLTPVLTDGVLS